MPRRCWLLLKVLARDWFKANTGREKRESYAKDAKKNMQKE